MVDGEFYFDDDLAYRKPGQKTWGYCMPTDPRFQREILEGVPRGGTLKYDSVHPEPAAIPPGCYVSDNQSTEVSRLFTVTIATTTHI
jgi:hypothetical protein